MSPGVEAVALLLKKLAVFLQRTAECGGKLAAGVALQSFGYGLKGGIGSGLDAGGQLKQLFAGFAVQHDAGVGQAVKTRCSSC